MSNRISVINRKTTETSIKLSLDLDGKGTSEINTGIPFFDHMLILFAKHGLFDLKVEAAGDLEVDGHHTVEDIGICLGQAIKESLGDKRGIKRYGLAFVPMDEALAMVSLDISGRAYLVYDVDLEGETIGGFDTDLMVELLQAVVNNAGLTLHVKLMAGRNAHHIVEAIFKALAKALDMGTSIDSRIGEDIPSTKGQL
jgi:imidazoleglycerol-phosphate dehydratase